jgi:hypothetical protein
MVVPSTAFSGKEHGGTEMQATQTRSQARLSARRVAIAIALFAAAVVIALSTLYVATGRTSSSTHAKPAQVQVASGAAAGAPTVKTDTQDQSNLTPGNADRPGLRGHLP